MAKLLSYMILISILISAESYAMSMGTVAKNDFVKIEAGNSAKFSLLFWNVGNESYNVSLYWNVPEGWSVIIEPENFVLNSSFGKEYIKLSYASDYVKATPVDILVLPPSEVSPDVYNITINAIAEKSSDSISISQERVFNLKVKLENPLFFESKEERNDTRSGGYLYASDEYSIEKDAVKNDYFLIVIIVIIFISLLVYKYS